jgi:putative hydrolase of the HAD superfamily
VKRITCLMLDLGGVLTHPQRTDKVDELMRLLGLACPREAFMKAYYAERSEYDRGAVDAAEYWRLVARGLGVPHRESSVPDLVRVDLESWFNMRPGMLDFAGGLRGRVARLLILSNLHRDGARYVREGEGRSWASRFDEVILSCEHEVVKPEREIYELALRAAGARPSEALFVDDNPENVEGARAAGLSSFVFAGLEDFRSRLAGEYELST